jgi:putative transposase
VPGKREGSAESAQSPGFAGTGASLDGSDTVQRSKCTLRGSLSSARRFVSLSAAPGAGDWCPGDNGSWLYEKLSGRWRRSTGMGSDRRHNRVVLLAHVVWATKKRRPSLPSEADGWLRQLLRQLAAADGCEVLACGNAADHVHALVGYPPTLGLASLVKSLKGASSCAWNRDRRWSHLTWQEGYWAESISPDAFQALGRYIEQQRVHQDRVSQREPWE